MCPTMMIYVMEIEMAWLHVLSSYLSFYNTLFFGKTYIYNRDVSHPLTHPTN